MGVKNDITIIRLILGHWAGKLSEPEKKELDNWLAQSEKHRIYFFILNGCAVLVEILAYKHAVFAIQF